MKKIASILLILLLAAVMMAGCGGSSGTSDSDKPDAAQTQQTDASGDTDEESGAAGNVNAEGLGDLLSSTYVEMMKNNEYMMKYRTTMDMEGQSIEMESTMAVSGDSTAVINKGGGLESTIIIKDDKVYMVDHASKTVMTWAQTQNDDPGTIDTEGITYIGSGKEDGLVYEEYLAAGSNLKYYFDGKKLVKMTATTGGQTMVMEILEMGKKIPAGMFDIPAGYQITEM